MLIRGTPPEADLMVVRDGVHQNAGVPEQPGLRVMVALYAQREQTVPGSTSDLR
jgi:hypothetical protein